MADPSTITTEAEAHQLVEAEAAIREAAEADRLARLRFGEALSCLRHRNVHREERDRRGRHPEISHPEAAALIAEFSGDLVRRHHLLEVGW